MVSGGMPEPTQPRIRESPPTRERTGSNDRSTPRANDPGSLVGAIRTGGAVLLFAFLSIVVVFLVFERSQMGPAQKALDDVSGALTGLERVHLALIDERAVRSLPVESRKSDAIVERIEVVDGALEEVRLHLEGGEFPTGTVVGVSRTAGAVKRWRKSSEDGKGAEATAAYGEVERSLADTSRKLGSELDLRLTALHRATLSRAWMLLALGFIGGVATWLTTLQAIRRTRRSLRLISDHVGALERGELGPRQLESYAEIGDVNHRLNTLGLALDRARAETRSERESANARQRELELAQDLVLDVSRVRSEAEIARVFCQKVQGALALERIEILRRVPVGDFFEEIPTTPEAGRSRPLRIVESPESCPAFRAGGGEGATAIRCSGCPAKPVHDSEILCLPLYGASGQIGVVHFWPAHARDYGSFSPALAATLVRLLAPALENARMLAESIERSTTDPLTALANRRRLEEFGAKQIALAQRQGIPFAVVALDIDRFKQINDAYGHDGGDRALVAVAGALRASIRESDLAARLGGDEFALLLPGSTATSAISVVDRVRAALREHSIPGVHEPIGISAGVAEMGPRPASLADLLAQADRALYAAKRARPGPASRAISESDSAIPS